MNTILFTGLNAMKKTFITISFDNENKFLVVEWEGIQTTKMVKEGGMAILEHLIQTKSTRVLNDNRKVQGTWTDSANWTNQVWMPLMLEAGLKHFAWIKPKDPFSKFSIQKVVDKSDKGLMLITYFVEEGVEWLKCVDEPIGV